MSDALNFILNNFKTVSTLKQSNHGHTELVCGDDDVIYIRKILPYTNTAFQKMCKLSSVHLPKIFYCLEDNGYTYVIEEYIKGYTLQEILDNRGFLDEALTEQIILQMCDVLEILHTNNIIHRDIKPSNMMLQADNRLVLIDFGAAREIKTVQGRDTVVLGTPGYAPPEQYGFAETDVRSDFYALGITMNELLGPEYDGKLKKIIVKCTRFDPQQRIASTKELKSLLIQNTRKKYMVTVLIVIFLGIVGFYWLKGENVIFDPMLQDIKVADEKNNFKKNSSKESAPAQEKKEVSQVKGKISEAEKQKEKTELEKSTKTLQTAVEFSSQNWDQFEKVGESSIRNFGVREIEKQGFILVNYRMDKWPRNIIVNNTDKPLNNPAITMYFTDFAISGDNFEVSGWGGRIEKTEYADAVYYAEYGRGVYKKVTLKLIGNVPANDYAELSLFGGINGYFVTGPSPTVRVVFRADNAGEIVQEYSIKIL